MYCNEILGAWCKNFQISEFVSKKDKKHGTMLNSLNAAILPFLVPTTDKKLIKKSVILNIGFKFWNAFEWIMSLWKLYNFY